MSTPITAANLLSVAKALGFDLENGDCVKFHRATGASYSQIRKALLTGEMRPQLAEIVLDLSKQITEGAVKPANATTTMVADLPTDPEDDLTDDQLLAGINKRFAFMRRFVSFAIDGKFQSVCITGPGGIGKTFPVEGMLRDADDGYRVIRMVSGAISAVKLVEMLWETRNKGDVLLIDDADGGLSNVDFLNVLKAATDSKGRRVVSWLKQNKSLAEAGVEPQFEYEGSVIIISNANMRQKAEKGNGHIDAVLSRAMHIDLGINSSRALALRVAHMIETENMFAQMFAVADMADMHDQAKGEISAFIKTNRDAFRSLTLREAAKIAKMYIACEGEPEWSDMALLSLGQL